MVNHTAAEDIRALVRGHGCLWMDAGMQVVKVVNALAQTLLHLRQEPAQGIGLLTAFNPGNPAVLNGQANRFTEVRGYADVPRPPAEHAFKDKNTGGFGQSYRRVH